jgi:hypothetical protein
MPLKIPSFPNVTVHFLTRLLSQPAWLMGLFLLLACFIPFAGGTSPFRGDQMQELDPFGFSLLTPSRHAFGPLEMLSLAALLLIPASLIEFHRFYSTDSDPENLAKPPLWVFPWSSFSFYAFFLLLTLPIITRSSSFPGFASIFILVIDILMRAISLSWIADIAYGISEPRRLKPFVTWMIAGTFHLGLSVADAYVISPQIRQIIEIGWTSLLSHAILAFLIVTFHSLLILRKSSVVNQL